MRVLYPADPLNHRTPDDLYAEECRVARISGLDTSTFSFEDFERGHFEPHPRLQAGEAILYRGWMLNQGSYARLTEAVARYSAEMIVPLKSYLTAHHLPSWYPLLKDFTAETIVCEENADFSRLLSGLNWAGYFIKDYVKSVSTSKGSLVHTPAGIHQVVSQLAKYRGEVEGGLCIRREENYVAGSERRYFVAAGKPAAHDGNIPGIVATAAGLISSPFFSIDTALRTDGIMRIVEIGDGQVSDRKDWSAEKFVEVLDSFIACETSRSTARMAEFLKPTATIDSTHPAIIAAAAEITGDAAGDEEIARRCFLWVRDYVRHSSDHALPIVTCTASDVLHHRAGFCYAKSHLLAALLRARGIPTALCYQRLAFDDTASSFFLHGLVAVHLKRHGWYRVDPRGNKPGVFSDFTPPIERLPYAPKLPGEQDIPQRFPDAMACVVDTLRQWPTAAEVRANLPDYAPGA